MIQKLHTPIKYEGKEYAIFGRSYESEHFFDINIYDFKSSNLITVYIDSYHDEYEIKDNQLLLQSLEVDVVQSHNYGTKVELPNLAPESNSGTIFHYNRLNALVGFTGGLLADIPDSDNGYGFPNLDDSIIEFTFDKGILTDAVNHTAYLKKLKDMDDDSEVRRIMRSQILRHQYQYI